MVVDQDFFVAVKEQEDLTQQIFCELGQAESPLTWDRRCSVIFDWMLALMVTSGSVTGTGIGLAVTRLRMVVAWHVSWVMVVACEDSVQEIWDHFVEIMGGWIVLWVSENCYLCV